MSADDVNFARRVMDLAGQTDHLNAVEGLGTIPLVTLGVALSFAVVAGVLDASQMARVEWLAYVFADDKLSGMVDVFGLSRHEIAAIHAYTQESGLYHELNVRLRNANRELLKHLFAYLKLLLTALYKLPVSTGTYWRGVKLPLATLGSYEVDRPVIWWAFSSTTANMGVLTSPVFLGNTGPRTIFALKLSSVVNIQPYSAIGEEEELLALPGTVLKTVAVVNQGPDLDLVQLEEDTTAPSLIDFPRPTDAAVLLSSTRPVSDVADGCAGAVRVDHSKTGCVAILGDISGSMMQGHRLEGLKKSFENIYDDHKTNPREMYFGIWSDRMHSAMRDVFSPEKTRQVIHDWIQSIRPRGTTNMLKAIDTAMRHCDGSIEDCFVICDGDVGDLRSEKTFQDKCGLRYPDTNFHFIAFGCHSAETEEMRNMARWGRGSLTCIPDNHIPDNHS